MKCTVSKYEEIRKEAERQGIILTDEEYRSITDLCERKIKLNNLDADYMELLLPDEIRHYAFGREVNKITFIVFGEMEETENGTNHRKTVSC